MAPVLTHIIDNYEYITRSQMTALYGVTYFDTQRFVAKFTDVETHQIGKIYYYRKVDVDRAFRKQKLAPLREAVLAKTQQVH